ncbi:MAG: hypothetical protein HYS07_01065 [Chlamydiae bacterium]|nr:hypothetical protein [Chlamydiota bacterium]MBI3276510.1 hypothetical protein [Chlamydiota bacterium]
MKSIQGRQNKIISTVSWPHRHAQKALTTKMKKPLGRKYTSILQQGKQKLKNLS